MTTEDDFRRAIDANPEDWQNLLVFSDWLRERNDARADGYAALAALRKYPRPETHGRSMPKNQQGNWFLWGKVGTAMRSERGAAKQRDPDALPPDWYDTVREFNQFPNWDAFASANPTYRIASDALTFVIVDQPGIFDVSNVRLGKGPATPAK